MGCGASVGTGADAQARVKDCRRRNCPYRAGVVFTYAQLRVDCQRIGHALSQRAHDADRWIVATAVRLGIPLVSNDGIFRGVSGLQIEILTSA